jgi:hypothetical protein
MPSGPISESFQAGELVRVYLRNRKGEGWHAGTFQQFETVKGTTYAIVRPLPANKHSWRVGTNDVHKIS